MIDPLLIGEEEALEICRQALDASRADETEVNVLATSEALTRFAENQIHQNVAESNYRVVVRAAFDNRVGIATANDVSGEGLRDVADRAAALAEIASPDESYPGLPAPGPDTAPLTGSEATAQFDASCRSEAARTCIEVARGHGQRAAGACSTSIRAHALANSCGIEAFQESTHANLRMVFLGDDSSGYAAADDEDALRIEPAALAQEAAEKCARSARPRSMQPGRYDVILEPAAVADMLAFLGYSAFGGLSYHEGRSAVHGRLGESVCGENITLADDPLNERGLRRAFDYEGVPCSRVDLISEGVAQAVVHDTRTARLEGAKSTGHALPPGSGYGPVPMNLVLSKGESDLAEMLSAIERGILVTRFHYTNLVDPGAAILTGMTRDGTFAIEGGSITGGVRNLRFTESILEALSRVAMIGSDGQLTGGAWTPTVLIRDFRFSGATEF